MQRKDRRDPGGRWFIPGLSAIHSPSFCHQKAGFFHREARWGSKMPMSTRPQDMCLGTVSHPTWLIEVLRCINQRDKISSYHTLTVVLWGPWQGLQYRVYFSPHGRKDWQRVDRSLEPQPKELVAVYLQWDKRVCMRVWGGQLLG